MVDLGDIVPDWSTSTLNDSQDSLLNGVEEFTNAGFINLASGESFLNDRTRELLQATGVNFIGDLLGLPGVSESSPRSYAQDMIEYAPKQKFLFKVQFIFHPEFASKFCQNQFTYVVKTVDRPSIEYDYEEVNMYNFRTKVLRAMRTVPLNMTFHDDIKNNVLNFFNEYRKFMSPIANLDPQEFGRLEELGMSFDDKLTRNAFSASTGVMLGDKTNVIKEIRLYQIFGHGSYVNEFTFGNPKIETMELDAMDMEDSTGNQLTCSFLYDSLHIRSSKTKTGDVEVRPMWGQKDLLGGETGTRTQFPGSSDADPDLNNCPDTSVEQAGFWDQIQDIVVGGASSYLGNRAQGTVNDFLKDKTNLSGNALNAAQGRLGTTANSVTGGLVNFAFGNKD